MSDTGSVFRTGVLAIAITGCYQPKEVLCDGPACVDGGPGDVNTDPVCVGAGLLNEVCAAPGGPVTFGTEPLDVDLDPRCDAGLPGACFIVATDIQIDGRLDVFGGRPLVLWSSHDITIDSAGVLDVASHSTPTPKQGPGSNPSGCAGTGATGSTLSTAFPTVGGGGGGGGFRTSGGAGGSGRNTENSATVDTSTSTVENHALHGGCAGGPGGFQDASRGRGGGAVYLMAGGTITIGGVIDASGGGGAGGDANANQVSGGGGGGSGGLIGLEAEAFSLTGARLAALGGGGGAGATTTSSGGNGPDPMAAPPTGSGIANETAPANSGGAGCGVTGLGGSGGGDVLSNNVGSGGGGGGGCGWIVIYSADPSVASGALVAPAPLIIP